MLYLKNTKPAKGSKQGDPITYDEWTKIVEEIDEQPNWRSNADKEMDYVDGKQLDTELLSAMKKRGIPPAMENIIAPALKSVAGLERNTRKDWRVTADGQPDAQDIADALNYKINLAERASKADAACSEAFRTTSAVGVGWVAVEKSTDPFEYPYSCSVVRRNEIWWDMLCEDKRFLTDARWLARSRWVVPSRIEALFPKHKELLQQVSGRWSAFHEMSTDGGMSTELTDSWDRERNWSIDEQHWWSDEGKRARLFEVWYRRWVQVPVLVVPDKSGMPARAVEFDQDSEVHLLAVTQGTAKVVTATVARMRQAYFLGPHLLHDGCTPYPHNRFPYVPFFYNLEDNTGVPYGEVRNMLFPQDSLNAGLAKIRWGMSSMRVERTKGAVAMPDHVFREQVASVSADIVLDANHMSQPGARFAVNRDYQLNNQQFQLLTDARAAIERTSAIGSAMQGRTGTATSGLQEQTQLEQANQSMAPLLDAFGQARAVVGEILMSMIIADMGEDPQEVVIEGNSLQPPRTVMLNKPERDPETGMLYISNDVQRTRLKVVLEDVPTTSGFRSQQVNALSEVIKSLPQNLQAAAVPHLVNLMDMPYKRELVEAIQKAIGQESPEAIEQRIKQAVDDALAKAGIEIKEREVAIKERKADAEIKAEIARAVQIGVQSAYSAMQAGAVIAQTPQVAPIADAVMAGAGYQAPNPMGDDPNFPQPAASAAMQPGVGVQANTSPAFSPVPQQPGAGMQGIETPELTDNV